MNDYGQMAFREDYRLGLRHLRARLTKRHKADPVRCVFEEVRTSMVWILNQPCKTTQGLEQYELDALILFKRYLKEGECQT